MGKHPSRWGHLLSGLAGGAIAALVFVMVPVGAKTGDAMILGAANRAGRSTWLTSKGPSVMKLSNTGGNPVLDLRNGGTAAPLVVDSQKRVINLNADRIDGRHARDLIRVGYDSTTDAADADGAAATVTITAPRPGLLVMAGTIDAAGNAFDLYTCQLMVNGTVVAGSEMHSTVHGVSGHTANNSENCATTGVQPVAAGSHEITLDIANWDSADLNDASLWAMYVPFDGTGNTPNGN